jgi:hypothetical protein
MAQKTRNVYMRKKAIVALLIVNIGVLCFITNWILSDEMNIVTYFTSDYVHSSVGILSTLGMFLVGLGVIVFSIFPSIKSTIKSNSFYYCIYGLFFFLLGIFPDDLGNNKTTIGIIHSILAGICLMSFLVIVSIQLIQRKDMRTKLIIVLYIVSIIGCIFLQLKPGSIKGIYQRIFIFSEIALYDVLIMQKKIE